MDYIAARDQSRLFDKTKLFDSNELSGRNDSAALAVWRTMIPQRPADNPPEFHRRRAEAEMEKALVAKKPSIAMLHLELARKHRERREQLIAENRGDLRLCAPLSIGRTDKEG